MIHPARKHLTLTLLAMGLTLAMAATVHAQAGVSASLQVNLGNSTHWTGIRGTSVKEIRQGERPGYDMFRYGGKYYAYDNHQWYSSSRGNGAYAAMEDRNVPGELSKVPQSHWQNYPTGWQDRANKHGNKPSGYGQHHS